MYRNFISSLNQITLKYVGTREIYTIGKTFKHTMYDKIGPLNIPESDDKNKTIKQLIKDLKKKMGLSYPSNKDLVGVPNRVNLDAHLIRKQSELPSRKMKDSYVSAIIPLATDVKMQNNYITQLGFVRNGRLLEDMDILAVKSVHNYIHNPFLKSDISPYVIVTMMVDRIEFVPTRLSAKKDIRIRGHVTHVGNSTAEVLITVEQKDAQEVWQTNIRGIFVMAVRNSTNTSSVTINPLIAETELEKKILQLGANRHANRLQKHKVETGPLIPTAEENQIAHELYLRTTTSHNTTPLIKIGLPPKGIWMENAKIPNLIFCHPQHSNMYNKVFGGYLMRHAIELSWSLMYLYSQQVGCLLRMSHVHFYRPVDLNSFLKITAAVTYTKDTYAEVKVYIKTLNEKTIITAISNSFYFTYKAEKPVPEIFPKTYHDTMLYLEGKRHFEESMLTQ